LLKFLAQQVQHVVQAQKSNELLFLSTTSKRPHGPSRIAAGPRLARRSFQPALCAVDSHDRGVAGTCGGQNELLHVVHRATNVAMDVDCLTLGFARRATAYKRPDLLFRDLTELRPLAPAGGSATGGVCGEAHPRDEPGKEMIRRVFAAAKELGEYVRVAYLPNYDMRLARLVTAGVDV
jgi:hypothetical protein